MWDPFWFVHEMFGWRRLGDAPSFDVKETDDAYVYKVKLTVPDRADVARMKAELDNGELTLVVPKAAAATSDSGFSGTETPSNDDKRSWISSAYAPTRSAYPVTSRLSKARWVAGPRTL